MASCTYALPLVAVLLSSVALISSSELGSQFHGGTYYMPTINGEKLYYAASLRIQTPYTNYHVCGAAILSHRFVVSAAQCHFKEFPSQAVLIGAHNHIDNGTLYQVKRIIQHPEFSPVTLANDIALFELKTPIEFKENKSGPIELGTEYFDESVDYAITSGWGSLPNDIALFEKSAFMQTIATKDCRERLPRQNVFDSTLCAIHTGGSWVSQGDIGGALEYMHKLVGIRSWHFGEKATYGVPDGFTRINSYAKWIREVMNA